MQGCAIKIRIRRKNYAYWNNFVVEGASLKDHIGKSGEAYQDDILKDDAP